MDFSLNQEQTAIRDLALRFAADAIAPHALAWDRDRHFPRATLQRAAALGLGGIMVAEAHGGSALGRLDSVLVYESLATACPAVAAYLSIHNMVATVIDRHGSPAQKDRWLAPLCRADVLASYCLTEPGSGSDAAALATRAVADGTDFLLTGQKMFISGAGEAGLYLAMARTDGAGPRGISAFLVDAGLPGISLGANERKMGWHAQPTRAVHLDAVRVPADAMLGARGQGFRLAMEALDGGRTSIAACSLGGAQAAFDAARTHLGQRHAFGKPLSAFQALQFQLADMASDLQVSRTFLWRAAWALDRRLPDATTLCAMAKKHVTDAGFSIANQALQMLGGYGYLADYGMEKRVRDLRVHQILEGTNEIMRLLIARALLPGGEHG